MGRRSSQLRLDVPDDRVPPDLAALMPTLSSVVPERSLAALLQSYLSTQVGSVLRGDRLIRSGDLRAIHSTRVAVRRYRSVLRVFATVLDPTAPTLDRALAGYAEALGAVRDLQIAGRTIREIGHELPGDLPSRSVEELLLATLDERIAVAQAALDRALTSRGCLDALGRLRRFPQAGVGGAADLPAAKVRTFLKAQHRRARKRLRNARRPGADVAAWHRARKAAKRTRYVAEAAVPQLGEPARRVARQAKAVQDELGMVQDAAVVLDLLRTAGERAARAGDTAAVTLGALYAEQHAIQRATLRHAAAALRL